MIKKQLVVGFLKWKCDMWNVYLALWLLSFCWFLMMCSLRRGMYIELSGISTVKSLDFIN